MNHELTNTTLYEDSWDKNQHISDSSQPSLSPKHTSQKDKYKRPKRNKSAFILFSSEMRAKFKADPNLCLMNSNETMVKLAELWKDLSLSEKEEYNRKADQDKLRYLEELNIYWENCPTGVIKNKTKKNHIKKPCSSYAIFVKEMKDVIKNENPQLKMADILKVISERWKNLSPDEKEIYQEKSRLDKEMVKAKLDENIKKEQLKNCDVKIEGNEVDIKMELEEPVTKKRVKHNEQATSFPKKVINNDDQNSNATEKDTAMMTTRSISDTNYSLKAESKVQDSLDFDFPELDFQNCHLNFNENALAQLENENKPIVETKTKTMKDPSESFMDFLNMDNGRQKPRNFEDFENNNSLFKNSSNLQPNNDEQRSFSFTFSSSRPSRIDIYNNTITNALKMRAENDFFKQEKSLETNFLDFQILKKP